MATKRDFVFGPDGEMLPSDSAPAQLRREEIAASSPKAEAKPAAKKETFREAFARNRAAGKETFTWNGKKYTTEMAKPAAKTASATPRTQADTDAMRNRSRQTAAARKAPTPADTRRPGPTRERAADMPPMTRAEPARPAQTTQRAATSEPRSALSRSDAVLRRDAEDQRRREERREFGRQRAEARREESTPAPRRRRAQRLREESQARRDAAAEMSPAERSMARGRRLRETVGSAFGMAKGGSVSKRADGIAKKGKTKCKII